MAHIHFENMRLYAEDASNNNEPWKSWEYKPNTREGWTDSKKHPVWGEDVEYRRKAVTVPYGPYGRVSPPLTVAPADGTFVWSVLQPHHAQVWCGKGPLLSYEGLWHLTKEAAVGHHKALLQANLDYLTT